MQNASINISTTYNDIEFGIDVHNFPCKKRRKKETNFEVHLKNSKTRCFFHSIHFSFQAQSSVLAL